MREEIRVEETIKVKAEENRKGDFLLAVIFCTAVAMMILEVVIARLSSMILFYHHVFVTISITILGLSAETALMFRLLKYCVAQRAFR